MDRGDRTLERYTGAAFGITDLDYAVYDMVQQATAHLMDYGSRLTSVVGEVFPALGRLAWMQRQPAVQLAVPTLRHRCLEISPDNYRKPGLPRYQPLRHRYDDLEHLAALAALSTRQSSEISHLRALIQEVAVDQVHACHQLQKTKKLSDLQVYSRLAALLNGLGGEDGKLFIEERLHLWDLMCTTVFIADVTVGPAAIYSRLTGADSMIARVLDSADESSSVNKLQRGCFLAAAGGHGTPSRLGYFSAMYGVLYAATYNLFHPLTPAEQKLLSRDNWIVGEFQYIIGNLINGVRQYPQYKRIDPDAPAEGMSSRDRTTVINFLDFIHTHDINVGGLIVPREELQYHIDDLRRELKLPGLERSERPPDV